MTPARGVSRLQSPASTRTPDSDIPMTAPRAKKGSAKDTEGIYVRIDPELRRLYDEAVVQRNISKRQLVEGALRRELADPTVLNRQKGLYDVA